MTKTPPTIDENSPFYHPKVPRSSREILKCFFFEPHLLTIYEESLTVREAQKKILKIYIFVAIITFSLWLLGTAIIAYLDLPNVFFCEYKRKFLIHWPPNNIIFFGEKWLIILQKTIAKLVLGLLIGLGIGLIDGITVGGMLGVAFGLAGGVVGGLTEGLILITSEAIGAGVIEMLAYNLTFGLVIGIGVGIKDGLAFGLLIALIVGLAVGITNSLILNNLLLNGLVIILVGIGGVFHLYSIFVCQIKSLFKKKLTNNVYLTNENIWLPIWGLQNKLIQETKQDIPTAKQFVKFLLQYRPLQRPLAMHLRHTIIGTTWEQNSLKARVLEKPVIVEASDFTKVPFFPSPMEKLTPSETWFTQLENLQQQLQVCEGHTNIALKKQHLEQFQQQLEKFYNQTLSENPAWNNYYLPALDIWKTRTEELLADLAQQAQMLEPITRNVYRAGEALEPSLNGAIFRGRNDLKDALTTFILTETQMPTLLLYGQRRVGKTSFLKFLPTILDYNFKVIYIDCQDTQTHTLAGFLRNIRQKANQLFSNKETETWQVPTHWATAWAELAKHLSSLCQGKDCKLIIALDEYEDFHTHVLTKDVAQAQELLGTMRSFSQHQKEVVLLFVGRAVFTDLQHPNWISYFPHVKVKKIDYLSKTDTLKLITQPTDDFNVSYPTEVPERIYHLTQGHPNLVQLICQGLVEIANSTGRKQLDKKDLEAALEEKVLGRQNGVIDVFWFDFCRTELQKQVIQAIVYKEAMPPKSGPVVRRFLDYGFIVKDGEGYTMRVPLFQEWLENYSVI